METTAAMAFVVSGTWECKTGSMWCHLHMDSVGCSVPSVLTGAIVLMYGDSLAVLCAKTCISLELVRITIKKPLNHCFHPFYY